MSSRKFLTGILSSDQEGKVVYTSNDGKSIKVSPAMEWLAMCSHIPNRCGQMVRYYGFQNIVRGFSSDGNPHFNYKSKTLDFVKVSQGIQHIIESKYESTG